ncbi:phosphatase PAP2 family protein [Planosporangium thailandense]|uniref:Phosphatase PAP2 family protein n=1 Tax=Planosporangium thailandense TaxID=765197 RepID=A0ABX0XYN0_9ACTN|nr:bifunctional DedA family/phosphatase PAP2 family protein [Planosporangium thailandense]NJC71162.1 phosphatase PAP2 family protein [Planosporangium thailandense]
MLESIARHILGLTGWAALAIVFTLPMLESSAFVGVVVPGELGVLLGGVLAYEHRVSLPAVLAAAVSGAIVGDSVGYWVGRRYGRRLLESRLGRVVKREHRERAERYLAERGGKAVFLGRFTAALRALIPGMAGMAGMPYGTFVVYNVAGGAVWASAMVMVGYLGGASWRRAERWASGIGLAILALVVIGLALKMAGRLTRRHAGRLRAVGDRLAATAPAAFVRRRFPAQVAWLRRRLDATTPDGLPLSAALAAAALLAWTFAGLTEDVIVHGGVTRIDPRAHAIVVAHRTGWLTFIMGNVTWLGSSYLLVQVLVVATVALARGPRRRAVGWLWVAYGGAVALYTLAKPLVHRPRPSAAELIGHATGLAFPSGHATASIATWGMLAIVLATGRPRGARVGLFTAAVVIVLLVGASRIYLGAHWPTDVLGGYALGGTWLSLLIACRLRRRGRHQPTVGDQAGLTATGTVTGARSPRGETPQAPPRSK